jgi:hypothetical protein
LLPYLALSDRVFDGYLVLVHELSFLEVVVKLEWSQGMQ